MRRRKRGRRKRSRRGRKYLGRPGLFMRQRWSVWYGDLLATLTRVVHHQDQTLFLSHWQSVSGGLAAVWLSVVVLRFPILKMSLVFLFFFFKGMGREEE